jgi:hypothetical protein
MPTFGSTASSTASRTLTLLSEVLAQVVTELDLDITLPANRHGKAFRRKLDTAAAAREGRGKVMDQTPPPGGWEQAEEGPDRKKAAKKA